LLKYNIRLLPHHCQASKDLSNWVSAARTRLPVLEVGVLILAESHYLGPNLHADGSVKSVTQAEDWWRVSKINPVQISVAQFLMSHSENHDFCRLD